MDPIKRALVRLVAVCFIGGAMGACSAAAPRQGQAGLRKSENVTSCGTRRAAGPGAVDTVDAGWLRSPLKILSYSDPIYPQEALSAGQNGNVEVQVLVAPDGSVAKVLRVDGPAIFADAAIHAVRGAELSSPEAAYGGPAVVCATLIVSFQAVEGGVAWLQVSSR